MVVFDALILLAVLTDHMNVLPAKDVDLTLPFDGLGLIEPKPIQYLVLI